MLCGDGRRHRCKCMRNGTLCGSTAYQNESVTGRRVRTSEGPQGGGVGFGDGRPAGEHADTAAAAPWHAQVGGKRDGVGPDEACELLTLPV